MRASGQKTKRDNQHIYIYIQQSTHCTLIPITQLTHISPQATRRRKHQCPTICLTSRYNHKQHTTVRANRLVIHSVLLPSRPLAAEAVPEHARRFLPWKVDSGCGVVVRWSLKRGTESGCRRMDRPDRKEHRKNICGPSMARLRCQVGWVWSIATGMHCTCSSSREEMKWVLCDLGSGLCSWERVFLRLVGGGG